MVIPSAFVYATYEPVSVYSTVSCQ